MAASSTLTGQATEVDNPEQILSTVCQDALVWASSPANYHLPKQNQKQLTKDYLAHYFSPWHGNYPLYSPDEIKNLLQNVLDNHLKTRGFAANSQLHNPAWMKNIANNADLAHFPNLLKKAITLADTDARLLPTIEPSFTEWLTENNSYPFDNMQNSFIAANTPVLVLHSAKDADWYLILSGHFFGWVKSQNIAFVSPAFIKRWQTGSYLTPAQHYDHNPEDLTLPPLHARIGNLYPLQQKLAKNYVIPLVVSNSNHQAVIKPLRINKAHLQPFPLTLSLTNLAQIVNELIGQPYGWGGMYGYRDCSSTLMDLMAAFAIWLPRNSGEQSRMGTIINLKDMNDNEKESYIIQHAIPFLTLIHLPGHIALYIGAKDNKAYIYHAVWHFHQSVITPLDLRKKQGISLLSRVDCINVLVNPADLVYDKHR